MPGRQEQVGSQQVEAQGQPDELGIRQDRIFLQDVVHQLENRFPVQRHGRPAGFGQGFDGEPFVGMKFGVNAAESGCIQDFQTGNHLDPAVAPAFGQVPPRTEVLEPDLLGNVGQRRPHHVLQVVQVAHPVLRADIVAEYGKLVPPGGEGIVGVAVNHHVAGESFEVHPCVWIALERPVDESFQHRHPFRYGRAHPACGGVGIARGIVGQQRHRHQDGGHCHQDPGQPGYDFPAFHPS